jgi:hypothetical protein
VLNQINVIMHKTCRGRLVRIPYRVRWRLQGGKTCNVAHEIYFSPDTKYTLKFVLGWLVTSSRVAPYLPNAVLPIDYFHIATTHT